MSRMKLLAHGLKGIYSVSGAPNQLYARYRKVQGVNLARWYGLPEFNSRDLIKRALNEFKTQIDNGTFRSSGRTISIGAASSPTLSHLICEYRTRYVKEFELDESIEFLIDAFDASFGKDSLEYLASNPSVIEKWLQVHGKEREWSPATYNRHHAAGRALFNWAIRRTQEFGIIANPFLAIHRKVEASRRRRRITRAQEKQLIAALPKLAVKNNKYDSHRRYKDREMRRRLYASLDTGMRAGEMLKVQRKHIQFGPMSDVWEIYLPPKNTKAGRVTGEYQTVYVASRRLKQELLKRRGLSDNDYVFGTEDGKQVKSFKKQWRRLYDLAGLPMDRIGGFIWHDLRHEFISNVAEHTDNPEELRELARHSDLRTTQRYLEARTRRLKTLARRAAKS
ncbi:MAG TPA: tyrosine-type recombinase/integrase [Vicinamibacterales bacterium]|jgi:integrase|nr:tyrosine-type recombinase/integrase [Vicinamibacterales bacterium]